MRLTRRDLGDLAAMGALAVGAAAAFVHPAAADTAADEAALTQSVEALRKALLGQDKAPLEALTAPQLSYGHSTGLIQNKAEFVNGVMTRKATVKSLAFPDLKIVLAGDAAIARHLYVSDMESEGKPVSIKIGVLAVWQKQGGDWKLLARQAYKLS
jgi:Domain of unknown function (DUF4440)